MFFRKSKKREEQEPLEMELSVSNYPEVVVVNEPTINEMLKEVLARLEKIEKKIEKLGEVE